MRGWMPKAAISPAGMQGFNDRNLYCRQTPCDQDFLAKLARDTEPEQLEEWYNRHVVTVYKELGVFDADGLFMADGTYLFVPDNPGYEGSQRLLFDEHNHPVGKKRVKEMTKAQRARCRWRRCYKAVLLLHCDAAGERFVVVGVRVLREKESEATALWPLLDIFPGHRGFRRDEGAAGGSWLHRRPGNRPAEAGPRHRHGDSHP